MPIDRRTMLGGTMGLAVASSAKAQQAAPAAVDRMQWPAAEFFRMWPGAAPGAPDRLPVNNFTRGGPLREPSLRGISEPIVAVYRPAKPDGRAVLAIPGGGYGFVSMGNEGINVAEELNPHGITVFALAYRLPGEGWADRWNVPLQDAQRAMRLIRARAATWQIDPAQLGIVGFSAGGHLAASLTVAHGDSVYKAVDAADAQSARPAYSGLIYPVINLDGVGTHKGSHDNLLGANPPADAIARYNTDKRLTADAPRLFIAHAFDDRTVGIDQSLGMIAAARAAKVPVEAHLFQSGGHGFGARHAPEGTSRRQWPELFERWISKP